MLKILVVEDNPVFRESFKQSLSSRFRSIVIEEAESGEEALEKVKINPPHLIFVDLRLPGINGLEAIKRIKAAFPEIRAAMVTGYDLPEYRQAAAQCGAEGFFSKDSLNWDAFKALVESIEKAIA